MIHQSFQYLSFMEAIFLAVLPCPSSVEMTGLEYKEGGVRASWVSPALLNLVGAWSHSGCIRGRRVQ